MSLVDSTMPDTARLILRDTRCVGQYFLATADQEYVKALPVGQLVTIRHERDNEHDKLAAICEANGRKIGYIPRESSPVCCLFHQSGYQVQGVLTVFANKGQPNPLLNIYAIPPEQGG